MVKRPTNPRRRVNLAWSVDRYQWSCEVRGHKFLRASLRPAGRLSQVKMSFWLPFLRFVNGVRLNIRWTRLAADIEAIYGAQTSKTLRAWRSLCPEALELYLKKRDCLVLCSISGDVVVFDETSMGSCGGISKAASSKETRRMPNKVPRDCVLKRLPARALRRPASCLRRPASASSSSAHKRPAGAFKRPSSVMKSVYNKGIAGTARDQRAGRWLFAAVLVGNKSTCYTPGMDMARKRSLFMS